MILKYSVLFLSACLLAAAEGPQGRATQQQKNAKIYWKKRALAAKTRARECKVLAKQGINCNDPVESGTPGPWINPFPATDAPPTDPPATAPPATDPPATDPPTDPPATDPPTDPPATDPPTDPPATLEPPPSQTCEAKPEEVIIPLPDLTPCAGEFNSKMVAKCEKIKMKAYYFALKTAARAKKAKQKAVAIWKKWNVRFTTKKINGHSDICKYLADSEVKFVSDGNIDDWEVGGRPVDSRSGAWIINKPANTPYGPGWYILAQAPNDNNFVEVYVEDRDVKAAYEHVKSKFSREHKWLHITGFPGWCDCETTKTYYGEIMTYKEDEIPDTYEYYYCYPMSQEKSLDSCM
jgi:hypothetical protein